MCSRRRRWWTAIPLRGDQTGGHEHGDSRSQPGLIEHADLIRERSDPDLEYFFKHALTQDVAVRGAAQERANGTPCPGGDGNRGTVRRPPREVTEILAYHYTQAGVTGKAVHYLRVAGTKAMDRYQLVKSQAHFERAYHLLADADPDPTRDRALVDLILDWAHLFYYRARLVDLGDLLDAHQDSVQRLEDETKRMWWLIWRGHADGCKLDQAGNMVHLDQAIEIAASDR